MNECNHASMSPGALSLICQIEAIAELAIKPTTAFSAQELAVICSTLKKAEMAVGDRLGRVSAFDPNGRAA